MKIAVFGLGYVGVANAIVLAQHHSVIAVDISGDRVAMINDGLSPIRDSEVEAALKAKQLDLEATTDPLRAVDGANFVIIATPTNYDSDTNQFDTGSVESVIAMIADSGNTPAVVIKSTIPVGFTDEMQQKHPGLPILFSPEFLREGRALYDNLHPSRIVVAGPEPYASAFAALLEEGAESADTPVLITGRVEAESIKLFANTYLAMRVAFFNELDTFAATHGLNVRQIIEGVGHDPRIGSHYNNPSFGYGGYCLPKDTKQLLANYEDIPQTLIRATVESNATRIQFIINDIASKRPGVVGVYRLAMKAGSDNFRESAVLKVIDGLLGKGISVVIFEPEIRSEIPTGTEVIESLNEFMRRADVIVANRVTPDLTEQAEKVYSRDIFGEN
ncbi:nucleotide sugar dehydrogenase [Brachybacterium sp. UMB0905]|uniref:nucleotide sugar dehydrogenase n=1 Tax=Brachybacterium sp. UMB0905 TaxID=2069310 RepID=UPI000C809750|nr:nucleotide sugar dehydrogenase [Brachybacterium sp. UMB0905]PMC74772.1 UDP-glucose 6-dehydrogenase [Brachybacterium sp. UMB0905]